MSSKVIAGEFTRLEESFCIDMTEEVFLFDKFEMLLVKFFELL